MTRVLLLHGGNLPHYRVPIYSYLSQYLKSYDLELLVTSSAIQKDNPHPVEFEYVEMPLSALNIGRLIYRKKIDVVIMFVDMRHPYLFPTYLITKGLLGRKMVWWGQGKDLAAPNARLKNLAYATEQTLCDAIILYADRLKKYLPQRFHHKTFVANNTLCISYSGLPADRKQAVLDEYGIHTRKNIICLGRLQKRKRIDNLVAAHARMNRPDIGLILAGPDTEGVLKDVNGKNVFKVGPIYGSKKFDLLSASDVYCLPGAVGLSIVDAFHCGLPLITEGSYESAEMMYLKDEENGFLVEPGNIQALADKLMLLLDNDHLRKKFSDAAKREISTNGHIDKLCAGFRDALLYAVGPKKTQPIPYSETHNGKAARVTASESR
jgi:glycosyltransferase involved in cell wall biosynthesis